jgi:amidase
MLDPWGAYIEQLDIPPLASGPLDGLRFAAKDLFDVAGHPTRAGNPVFAERWGIPSRHAWAVEAFLRAGARLVAKTHTHELAYGMTGINPHFGTPRNPRVPEGIPGGSSSGSAVAVAAGLVPLALGSDTGGSVRIPASFCGILGFRPTHGLIPLDGVVPLAPSFDTVGLLARDPELLDRAARVLLPPLNTPPLKGLLLVREGLEVSTPEAQQAVLDLLPFFERLGCRIEEVHLDLEAIREVQRILQGTQAWGIHEDWINRVHPPLGEDVAHLLKLAQALSSGEIGRAMIEALKLRKELQPPSTCIYLLPATPSSAPPLVRLRSSEEALAFRQQTLSLTCVASMGGLPAVAAPSLQEPPVGIQLVGPRGSDLSLLELVQRYMSHLQHS